MSNNETGYRWLQWLRGKAVLGGRWGRYVFRLNWHLVGLQMGWAPCLSNVALEEAIVGNWHG